MFENKTKLIEDLRYSFPDAIKAKRSYLKKSPDGITVVYTTDAPHVKEIDVTCDEALENISNVSALYSAEFSKAAGGEAADTWDVVPFETYCSSYEALMETFNADLSQMGANNKIVLHRGRKAYVAMTDPEVLDIVTDALMEKVRNVDDMKGVMQASTLLCSIEENGITMEDIEKAGFTSETVPGVVKTYTINGTDESKEFTDDSAVQAFLIGDLMGHVAKFCMQAEKSPYDEKIEQTIRSLMNLYQKIGKNKDYTEYIEMRGWTFSTEQKKAKIKFD